MCCVCVGLLCVCLLMYVWASAEVCGCVCVVSCVFGVCCESVVCCVFVWRAQGECVW